VRAQRQDLPRVRVGGPRLGVQVIAVVPDHDQAEVADRGEHGGPGTRDHPGHAAPDREPAAVALGRPEAGRQGDVLARAEQGTQGRVDLAEVAGVGDDDKRSPPARGSRRRGARDLVRPVRAGQGRPDRPRRLPIG